MHASANIIELSYAGIKFEKGIKSTKSPKNKKNEDMFSLRTHFYLSRKANMGEKV